MDENLEQKYEILVDNLLDIIVELDLNGNFIFISPQSVDITGYHNDEIIGTSIYQCIHPNDLSILKNAIEDAKIDRKHISLEFRIKHKNGNYIYLSAKGRLVDIDGKQKIIVLASELSKNKGKLKESEKILNKIIDQTFMGFAILQDFEIKFLNPKFSEVIGYSYEEIMNWKSREVFKIIHPQDREEFISLAQEVYLGNNDALNSFQFRVITKYGDQIWLEIQTKPINYKGNKADLIFLQDITAKKEAEQKLKESEEQSRNLISNLTDIVLKINLKGVVTYVSPQTYDIMGYQPSELIGKNCFNYICSEDWLKIAEAMKNAVKTKDILSVEYRLLHKNGNKITASGHGRYTNFNGNEGFIVTIRDITVHKEIEDKLKESEEKFRTIAEQSFMGITIVLDNAISYANQAILDLFGYSLDEVKSWQPLDYLKLFPPKDREFISGQLRKQQDGYDHSIHNYQVQFIKKNGESGWLDLFSNPIEYKGKLGAMVSVINITERKIAEQQLKESEEKYRLITEHSNDLIDVLDEKFRYEYINEETHKKVLGYSKEDMIGKFAGKFVHPDDMEDIVKKLREGFEKGIGMTECRIKKKDGTYIWYESEGTTYLDQHGNKKALIMSRDITERKKAEQKLRESEEKFRTIAEQSLMGITIIQDDVISYANQAILDIFGYSLDEVISWQPREFLKLFLPKYREYILGQERKQQDGFDSSIHNYEVQFIKKNGELGWLELFSNPIKYRGKLGGMVSFIDITERKKAEQRLKESEERLKILYKFAPDAYYLNDINGNFVDGNDAAERLIGYKKEELIDKNFSKILPENQIPLAVDLLRKNMNGINTGPSELLLKHKDGREIPVEIRAHPIKINDQHLVLGIARDITERKIAEQKLKESEEKYRQLFKILPLSLILISREGIFADCNTGTEKLFGYKREELIGKDFRSFPIIATNNLPLFEERLEFLFKGEILEPIVFEALSKNGESLWVNSHVSLVKIRNKNLALIIGQNITDERRAAYKIKESEEKFRHIFEKSPFSIILFDSEGIIKDCNSATEDLFGFKKEEFLGNNYFHNPSINPDHLPITKKRFEQLKVGESLHPQELKIFRADGTFIWINTQISKVRISNQTYFYSIIQDITTKKILEDIMFELNQNFFNYTSDFQENIQSLAQTAKKLSKGTLVLYAKKVFHEDGSTIQIITSENEVIECDFIDFKQKYFINEIFELKLETPKFFPILSKNNYTMEDPFIQKYSLKGVFGKVIKNIDDFTSIIAILYENPPEISHEEQLVLLLISDAIAIEEKRWQLLEKLEEQNSKLSELDKLKSEFLRMISHELKTPLISIKGYSQLLLYNNKGIFDNDTLSMIEEITRGCVRLENLISELIESSKLESAQVKLNLTFEDLALLINNSVNELLGVAKSRNQEIIINLHEKLITKFEKERIHEVVGNLLTNAIKYSPPSNSIVIKSEINEEFYVISVKDNGIGFTPGEKQKLFKQFGKIYRFDQETNLATEGSGLGLYITKKLVELHGGKIWVESEGRNKGSTFYFTLPIIKD